MFTYLTAGESHGKMLTAIIKNIPAGLALTKEMIDCQLARRQQGYGRGGRMKIETDRVEITSGVRHGLTLGSPVTLVITNRDWENWQEQMAVEPLPAEIGETRPETSPRPGHADLAGAIKYNTHDLRNILERASARETAIRTAVGAVCRQFLCQFGIEVWSHIVQIGEVRALTWEERRCATVGASEMGGRLHSAEWNRGEYGLHISNPTLPDATLTEFFRKVDESPLRCGDPEREREMIQWIDTCKTHGDSVGGVFEIIVTGLPVGLGSHIQWDERLDGKLAQALIAIQGIKGVEFGLGFTGAGRPGSQVHDPIYYQPMDTAHSTVAEDRDSAKSLPNPQTPSPEHPERNAQADQSQSTHRGYFFRTTNHAGGLEGGMTNGEPLIIRAAMKPIPTLMQPLHSVDLCTKAEITASKERSDVCAVPAASIVGEAVVAITLAQAFAAKFGGDSMAEIHRHFQQYQSYVEEF